MYFLENSDTNKRGLTLIKLMNLNYFQEVQKDALNELKILEEYLTEKEVDFENQKKVYLSQINDLRKQLIEKSAP